MTRGVACARAALAGNPSDGYGGAVLALTLPALTAAVTASAGPPAPSEPALLRAARARLGVDTPALEVATTIPREVGLGGSSAIVVAALRALAAWHELTLAPERLARLALEAETLELGIAAGPQDRVVQATEGLVYMDFSGDAWHAERLDRERLPPLYVAWLAPAAQPSGVWHAALAAQPRGVIDTVMAELAALARLAREAVLAGDRAALAACIDGSLDARARLGTLEPAHLALADAARACGASANFTGSGGAIVGTLPPDGPAALQRSLEALGCAVLLT